MTVTAVLGGAGWLLVRRTKRFRGDSRQGDS